MKKTLQDRVTEFLYRTVAGRCILKVLISPGVSRIVGRVMDTRLSVILVKPFMESNHIDMSQYEKKEYRSWNDFFTRRIKSGLRPVEQNPECLVSPCDGRITLLPINSTCMFRIKNSQYTVAKLLRDKWLAKKYSGGMAAVIRLAVDDYHRYCYVDDGVVANCRQIPGVLHTVQPIANVYYPIYHENTREYCTLYSENFGDVIVMEVGAMLVGRICNEMGRTLVKRGEEKGRFEYGGSTIVLLFEKDKVEWNQELLGRSMRGIETPVKLGEVIGRKKHPSK